MDNYFLGKPLFFYNNQAISQFDGMRAMINESTDHGNDVLVTGAICSSQISHAYYLKKKFSKNGHQKVSIVVLAKTKSKTGPGCSKPG